MVEQLLGNVSLVILPSDEALRQNPDLVHNIENPPTNSYIRTLMLDLGFDPISTTISSLDRIFSMSGYDYEVNGNQICDYSNKCANMSLLKQATDGVVYSIDSLIGKYGE